MMPADLESGLRALGRTLDEQGARVGVDEIVARSRTDRSSMAGRVEDGVDVIAVREPNTIGGPRHRLLLAGAATLLVVTLVGAFVVLGRAGPADAPAVPAVDSTEEQSAEPMPTDGAPPPTVLPPQQRLVEATVIPVETTGVRPDAYPIAEDPDAIGVFGNYVMPFQAFPRVIGLIGRLEDDGVSDGVKIETVPVAAEAFFSDSALVFDEASIDGIVVDVSSPPGGVPTVVLPGSPTILLTGRGALALLERTGLDLATATWSNGTGRMGIDRSVLPEGYDVIVEPEFVTSDAVSASTSTGLEGSDGPNADVQIYSPLPDVAMFAELDPAEINGSPGWSTPWSTPTVGGFTVVWQVSPTTWASVRARGATGVTLTLEESIAVAESFEFVDEATWRAEYRIPEPDFGGTDFGIAIDIGAADGVDVGMLVQTAEGPVGRISTVGDGTSQVQLRSDPAFVVDATVLPDGGGVLRSDCRVRGGNDHVGFVCDAPFDDEVAVGASVVAAGENPMIVQGTGFGTITSITQIGDETVALLGPLDEFPIAGDRVAVVDPGR